jgi:hypothetical protein
MRFKTLTNLPMDFVPLSLWRVKGIILLDLVAGRSVTKLFHEKTARQLSATSKLQHIDSS